MKLICHQCGIEFEKVDKEIRDSKIQGAIIFSVDVVAQQSMRIKLDTILQMTA